MAWGPVRRGPRWAIAALASALLAGTAASASPRPGLGPLLGTFTLRERPLPLPKPGSVRPLPPPEERLRAMARLAPGFQAAALAPYGWRVESEHLGFAVLEGDPATAPALEALDGAVPGLLAFRPTRAATGALQAARRLSRVDGIQSWGPLANPMGLSGKGVLVGIIDFGFDTRHPAFLDSAGGSRFLGIWDPHLPAARGAPFNRGQLKRAGELAADTGFGERPGDVHGTIVASIAVGSDRSGPWWGVAPEASVLAMNLSGKADTSTVSTETDVMQGIQWMFRVADSLKMPCVVNLSLGNQHLGPHDGTSLFDRFLDTVTGPGRIVVGASGNDGAKRLHVRIPLAAGDTVGTWARAPTMVDVWGEAGRAFRYQVLLMDSATGAYMAQTVFLSTSTGRGRVLADSIAWTEPGTGRKVPLLIALRPESAAPENGKPHVEIRVIPGSRDTALAPRGLLLGVRFLGTGSLHAWNVYSAPFQDRELPGYVAGDNDYTLSEIGGTAKSLISVGAYVSTRAITDYQGRLHEGLVGQEVGEAAAWSSRGPSADGRVKPDLSAPGRLVVSAMSKAMARAPDWMEPYIVSWPDRGSLRGRYMAAEGTSQAAPMVTGTAALLLQAKPDLTPAQIRDILAQTTQKDAFTGPLATPDGTWGYGKLDVAAAVRKLKDIPVRSGPARTAAVSPRARLVGGRLRLEGLGRDVLAAARGALYDRQGRLVSALEPRDGSDLILRAGAPSPGVYLAVIRAEGATLRFRVLAP